MSTIEDELRAVMERVSAPEPSAATRPVDRRAEVGARIRRRKRARAASSAAVLALVVIAGGVAAVGWRHPAQTAPASANPVPSNRTGATNDTQSLVSQTMVMPTETSLTVDFTPASWRLSLAASCISDRTQHLSIAVNGRFVENVECQPASPAGNADFDRSFDEQFWKAHGVRLGQASTISVTVMVDGTDYPNIVELGSGVASIDVYVPTSD